MRIECVVKHGNDIASDISTNHTYADVENISRDKFVFVSSDYEKQITNCANDVICCKINELPSEAELEQYGTTTAKISK